MYKLTPVKSIKEVNSLRNVRNACREFMTHYQEYISLDQQLAWFASLDPDRMRPYLFQNTETFEVIGFGLIKLEAEQTVAYVTGGLMPEQRGKGIGKLLFMSMLSSVPTKTKVIKLDVFKDNISAIKTYHKLGFETVGEDNTLYYMEKPVQ